MSMAAHLTALDSGDDLCRTCLQSAASSGTPKHLFHGRKKSAGSTVLLAEMLSACSPYTVTESDGFPLKLCCRCYKKLCSAYKFRLLCESSYISFLNHPSCPMKFDHVKIEKETQNSIAQLPEPFKTKLKSEDSLCKFEDGLCKFEDSCYVKLEDDHHNDMDYDDEPKYSPPDVVDGVKVELESVCKAKRLKKGMDKKMYKSLKKSLKAKKKLSLEEKKDSLTCAYCARMFKWKHLLIAHQDSHFGIKRYYCEICKKDYRNEKDHKSFHRRGLKFQCDTCAKRFNTKAKLAIHLETHSADREKIFCDIDGCDRVFLSINGLDRHKLSHTGLKNFICQVCSKCFIDKYQLEVHLRIHTNDRRFNCGFCDKKFITTSARNAHEKWHTKVKNYVCQHCEKGFVSSSGLKRHILCHTKEQRQECRFCGKKFARFDNKKRHEMTTHQLNDKPLIISTSDLM